MNLNKLRLFIQLSRPLFLLGAMLFYILGVSMARYLGTSIDWGLYGLGQIWVTLMQLSTHYLNEYFDAPQDISHTNRTFFSGGSGAIGAGKLSRNTPLIAAAVTLTLAASNTVVLLQRAPTSPLPILLLIMIAFGAIFYSVPPIKLATSGYGELTTSFLVANLVPALAFVLQNGEYHRILAMSTFPLTALFLAMMLVFEFPDYATDLKHEKRTLLVRLGWQRGMTLHNLLILSAFLILGLAVFSGLPASIALPVFIPLPLGLLQIWQMRRIAAGGKPNWHSMGLSAIVLMMSAVYLLAFGYWMR